MEKVPVMARVIVEILGAPREHVENALQLLVERIRERKELSVLHEQLFEPKKKDEKDMFFSAFTELEIKFDNWDSLLGLCFDYLPSSVEVLEPEEFAFSPADLSALVNDMLARLHGVDMALKEANAERAVIQSNFTNLLRNMVMLSLRSGSKPLSELSADIGVVESQLKPFLERFVMANIIRREGGEYSLAE